MSAQQNFENRTQIANTIRVRPDRSELNCKNRSVWSTALADHAVALARLRNSGILRSAGIGRSDSAARSRGDRGRVNPGILLIGRPVGPSTLRQCLTLVRLTCSTAPSPPRVAQWNAEALSCGPATKRQGRSSLSAPFDPMNSGTSGVIFAADDGR